MLDRFCKTQKVYPRPSSMIYKPSKNIKKTSKTTKNHQKTSTNIKKHQQTSKKTIWCFQVIWSFVVFSDSGRLIFGGRFCWSFLMFVDVFWCFLMFFDVFWSILVVKWWSGENRKGFIGPSSMLTKPSKIINNHQKTSKNINKHQTTSEKTIWCFLVIWCFVVFSYGDRLVFRGLFFVSLTTTNM